MKFLIKSTIALLIARAIYIVFFLNDWLADQISFNHLITVMACLFIAYFLGFFLFGEIQVPGNKIYLVKQRYFSLQQPFSENRIMVLPPGTHRKSSPCSKILYHMERTPFTVTNTVYKIRSKDGVSHEIKYSLTVQTSFDTHKVFRFNQLDVSSLSRSVWNAPQAVIHTEVEEAIRMVVGKFDADALNRGEEYGKLNLELRDELVQRLAQYHYKPIKGSIGSISAPPEYTKAHLQSHARAYESSAVSKAITEIQKVLNGLSDSDKALLTNMEMISMVLRGQGGSSITINDMAGGRSGNGNGTQSDRYINGRTKPTFGNSSVHVVTSPAA